MGTCVYIFTGHYGSGKTEAAVNFALKLKRQGKNAALIDMDIVNPFFRSADAKALLEGRGIRVETPLYANTNVDMPALTGVMSALIHDESYDLVLDVGGDDLGAKAVGRYREDILSRENYIQFFVMNPKRPFTKDLRSSAAIYDEIEAASMIKCGGIVNNTNLLDETTPETILDGLRLVNETAALKGVPVRYHAVTAHAADTLIAEHGDIFTEDNVIRIDRTVTRLF